LTGPSKPDSFWETEKVETVSDYIKNNSNSNDYLFVLSSDPIFYYTTARANPTRYSISWFADPAPLEDEMLQELKLNPPKLVLYESGTYYDRPEFIPMKDRLPLVNRWIVENYKHSTSIDGAIILSR
jgi:hypothetical protein